MNSHLMELDISHNDLQDAGIELLCPGLQSPHCNVEILRSVEVIDSNQPLFVLQMFVLTFQ